MPSHFSFDLQQLCKHVVVQFDAFSWPTIFALTALSQLRCYNCIIINVGICFIIFAVFIILIFILNFVEIFTIVIFIICHWHPLFVVPVIAQIQESFISTYEQLGQVFCCAILSPFLFSTTMGPNAFNNDL